ncbi:hypothetical protein [Streptomyces sp. NPDC126514]|uniref:hypothetical protein n=1 Tax=Streptomyces sp. NPDC126514 TaxID=3155210 RepID=UPI00332CE818
MPGTTAAADVTSQYTTQVTRDLEHNIQEQQRLTTEIITLQEQLTRLQHDHSVLVTVAQALGVHTPASAGTHTSPGPLPPPRHHQPTPAQQPTTPTATAETASTNTPRLSSQLHNKPTLVELTRRHLAAQDQPHSAAQITQALSDNHPERTIKATVVRTTLENLVAKNQAQRTKQGPSVYYTAPPTQQNN